MQIKTNISVFLIILLCVRYANSTLDERQQIYDTIELIGLVRKIKIIGLVQTIKLYIQMHFKLFQFEIIRKQYQILSYLYRQKLKKQQNGSKIKLDTQQQIQEFIKQTQKNDGQFNISQEIFLRRDTQNFGLFDFKGSIITKARQGDKWAQLLGNRTLCQKNSFSIIILQLKNMMRVGLRVYYLQQATQNRVSTSQNQPSKVIYVNLGDIIKTELNKNEGTMVWYVNQVQKHRLYDSILKHQKTYGVPLVYMKDVGDEIQWLN